MTIDKKFTVFGCEVDPNMVPPCGESPKEEELENLETLGEGCAKAWDLKEILNIRWITKRIIDAAQRNQLKYGSKIHECRKEINLRNKEIIRLQQKVNELQAVLSFREPVEAVATCFGLATIIGIFYILHKYFELR